ncbi:glycosyltransferase [Paracoccus ravus]|uniref:glycosyltransferase n=1 Tax=Paracoccus ravus TaxID=2447760 RepID=UPI0014310DB2|nr:glycosyltransferase [Paracoccus ravus]
MDVVGICRFSLLGRGDWKAFRGISDEEAERVYAKQAELLFRPERLEARLATFEHLTLASMAGQSDPNFHFLVLASELMPAGYRERLSAICAPHPQVSLRFFPIINTAKAQERLFQELGLTYDQALQFRLDDDDCVSFDYVEKMRQFSEALAPLDQPFSLSFSNVLFVQTGDAGGSAFLKRLPFMSAGPALRHSESIFRFGHLSLGRRFASLVIPGGCALVTKHDGNDSMFRPGQRGMSKLSPRQRDDLLERFFPFLSDQAKDLAGFM